MAIYKAGPAGSFKGKLGELVLTKWKKLLVGRSAPGKATKPPTAAQEGQRLKFSLVSTFLTANRKAVDIHAYLFFVSDNGKLVSAPQYLGSFFLKNSKR